MKRNNAHLFHDCIWIQLWGICIFVFEANIVLKPHQIYLITTLIRSHGITRCSAFLNTLYWVKRVKRLVRVGQSGSVTYSCYQKIQHRWHQQCGSLELTAVQIFHVYWWFSQMFAHLWLWRLKSSQVWRSSQDPPPHPRSCCTEWFQWRVAVGRVTGGWGHGVERFRPFPHWTLHSSVHQVAYWSNETLPLSHSWPTFHLTPTLVGHPLLPPPHPSPSRTIEQQKSFRSWNEHDMFVLFLMYSAVVC